MRLVATPRVAGLVMFGVLKKFGISVPALNLVPPPHFNDGQVEAIWKWVLQGDHSLYAQVQQLPHTASLELPNNLDSLLSSDTELHIDHSNWAPRTLIKHLVDRIRGKDWLASVRQYTEELTAQRAFRADDDWYALYALMYAHMVVSGRVRSEPPDYRSIAYAASLLPAYTLLQNVAVWHVLYRAVCCPLLYFAAHRM